MGETLNFASSMSNDFGTFPRAGGVDSSAKQSDNQGVQTEKSLEGDDPPKGQRIDTYA
jgi:hypothetical protein